MDSCKHCNFRNTSKCELAKLDELFEEGELTEDQLQDEYYSVLQRCNDQYYDWELDQGDIRNDR